MNHSNRNARTSDRFVFIGMSLQVKYLTLSTVGKKNNRSKIVDTYDIRVSQESEFKVPNQKFCSFNNGHCLG